MTKRLSLGLREEERRESVSRLNQVFCSISLLLPAALQLYWLSLGRRQGELYKDKLDLSWRQLQHVGLRIIALGGEPSLSPREQEEKEEFGISQGKSWVDLVGSDFQAEDQLCSDIRQHMAVLHRCMDWSSLALLENVLWEREDIIRQLETIMDEPVLEHIWEDEDMTMERKQQREGAMH